jgi:hypothetical protein
LRQAYDYWQDQPGNYFPETTFVAIAYSRRARGGTLRFHDVEFINFYIVDPPQLADAFLPTRGVQATSNPQMASPCFPFSHVSSKIPLSRGETKVTALDEDYQ